MKKLLIAVLVCLLLQGCGQPEVFETMSDQYLVPETPEAQETSFWLPEGAALQVSGGSGEMYLCDDFTVSVQTFPSGDLDATLRSVTGYGKDRLSLLQWKTAQGTRTDCAWASQGEEGDLVARTLVLDDGNWHYTLTVQADAQKAAELAATWADMFHSFKLGQEEITKG